MKRRNFLTRSLLAGGLATQSLGLAAPASDSASISPGTAFGEPLIAGPDPANLAILQAVLSPASGYGEISVNDGAWQKILPEHKGMVAFETTS